ncbi:histone acetyltransferase type B catalytic subunit isoform X2 [Anabrus simplex]
MAVAKSTADLYVTSSNTALELKLVRKPEDLEDDSCTFKPEMTHQVFGDSETIFGYRDLKIKLYYTAASLMTYLGVTYTEKVDASRFDLEADDVMGQVSKVIQPGYKTNLDDFRNDLPKDASFVPYGELLHSFSVDAEDNSTRTFEVYQCDIKTPGFTSYHERLQTFILWYIDAASFIDIDDERWRFFLCFEKYKGDGENRYAITGYATVYEYYAYPLNMRPRIGQMLILPPFQRRGLGCQLLSAIYQYYIPSPNVIDITVESPSDEFQRLRDYVDVKSCSEIVESTPELLKEGYSKKLEEAFSKLKLSKRQMRRVYEILRLKFTNTEDVNDYKQYRLEVKKRLNIPYQKEKADLKKLRKILSENEYQATLNVVSPELRMENLDREYRELEAQYKNVLEHLSLH